MSHFSICVFVSRFTTISKASLTLFTTFTPFRCGIYSHPSRQNNLHKLPSVNNLAIIFLSHLQMKILKCTKVITSVVGFQEEVEALILFCHDDEDVYRSPFVLYLSEPSKITFRSVLWCEKSEEPENLSWHLSKCQTGHFYFSLSMLFGSRSNLIKTQVKGSETAIWIQGMFLLQSLKKWLEL